VMAWYNDRKRLAVQLPSAELATVE
jgi:hypothetical protein